MLFCVLGSASSLFEGGGREGIRRPRLRNYKKMNITQGQLADQGGWMPSVEIFNRCQPAISYFLLNFPPLTILYYDKKVENR